jgi:hypothetical protein
MKRKMSVAEDDAKRLKGNKETADNDNASIDRKSKRKIRKGNG